jgi:hypothetical protein
MEVAIAHQTALETLRGSDASSNTHFPTALPIMLCEE